MLKGRKTRLFGTLVILLAIIEGIDINVVLSVVPPEYQWLVTFGIGVAIIVLRELTDGPPGRPPSPPDDDIGYENV